jgi:hypothetical protein
LKNNTIFDKLLHKYHLYKNKEMPMAPSTKSKVLLSALLLICFIPFFSLCGCGGSTSSTTTTSTGGTTTPTDLSSLTVSFSNNLVTYPNSVTVFAQLIDANGNPVPGISVAFAQDSTLLAFSPATTALTNGSGVAQLTVSAASTSSAGATNVTASAPLTTSGTTSTITSAPAGIEVGSVAITLGAITLGSSSISSYGTSSVTVPVNLSGSATTLPVSVTFNSPCVGSGLATLTTPVTNNSGTVTSTYKDNGCNTGKLAIPDEITASVATGASVSADITILPTAVGSIQFVSATPTILGTTGTTLPQSSIVEFQVLDDHNKGKAGIVVDFSLIPNNPLLGITLSSPQATSDAYGKVTASVTSGPVPTPLWVVAKVDGSGTPGILTQSNQLTITTGLPTQNFFSLSRQTFNLEGWGYDGVTSTVTVIASDRLGNPVPDGTAITFIAEGGQFVNTTTSTATCTTTGGGCTVTFESAQYKPLGETINYGGTIGVQGAVAALEYDGVTPITITQYDGTNSGPLYVKNGRVTILAYAVGEMSFVDAHGTNAYQSGDTFYDLGWLFLDSNENGILDNQLSQPNLQEQTIGNKPGTAPCGTQTYNGSGYVWSAYPDNYADVPSVQSSCSGVWGQTYVRREAVEIFSSLNPLISQVKFTSTSCTSFLDFWLMDENYNPMPAGTTVSVVTSNNFITYTPLNSTAPIQATVAVDGGSPVLNTTHAGGTLVRISVAPVTGEPCDPAQLPPGGSVELAVTTPLPHSLATPVWIYLNP